MTFRLSVFPELARTLAAAWDKNFMKLDKEEAKIVQGGTLVSGRAFHWDKQQFVY